LLTTPRPKKLTRLFKVYRNNFLYIRAQSSFSEFPGI
jgi:hypothetical protein